MPELARLGGNSRLTMGVVALLSFRPVNRGLNEGGSRWPCYARWVYTPRDSINVLASALGIVQGQIRTLHQGMRVLAMDRIDTDPCATKCSFGVRGWVGI